MQPLSGNQRPNLLTSLMNMSLVMRLPREMHLYKSCSNVPNLPSFLELLQTLTFSSLLARCRIPCTCHAKSHLNLQKWSEHVVFLTFFNILTWKCASCHNSVHFFIISTSKSVPRMVCSVHFDFEMCFAPQRRALFQLPKVLRTRQCFTLLTSKVLRASTACTFSTSQLPKVVRTCGVLYILTSKCASRHHSVQIVHLSSGQMAPHPPL